jgi:ATP-dependent DNA helicase RecQ
VQRTGWGKSAVYFVATALLRHGATDAPDDSPTDSTRGGAGAAARPGPAAGPTVIVSPLLALMRNQVDAAAKAGIHARTINSANLDEWDEITAAVQDGTIDLLLISPERLNSPDFRDGILPKLAGSAGLLVVDEAHCVSDWGHDFRPDYRRLRTFLAELAPDTPVLATTATANARVTADVAEQLGATNQSTGGNQSPGRDQAKEAAPTHEVLVLRGSLERDSLRLGVLDLPTPAHRLGWLADHLAELPGSGIIYTLTVAAARETAEFLRGRGFPVADYTGQSEDADRRVAEADLLNNRVKALVATSALGMGFDKPDLGFVVHLGAPASPIAYYQQVGRAGRAVDRAEVLLLPGREDTAIWRYFASLAFPPEDQVRATLAALPTDRPMSVAALETRVELRRARLEMMLKVLDVDGAVRRVRGGWLGTGAPWTYDTARLARVASARTAEAQSMLDYAAGTGCRMDFLRRCLDDGTSVPCGRCDNCTGSGYPRTVGPDALAAAQAFLGRPGVEIAPRKQWPTGLAAIGVPLTGKIPARELAEPGRAVGRLADLGWGERLRAALDRDAEVTAELVDAMVGVLADWRGSWLARPVAVVGIDSAGRPRLVRSLAERIATIGRLPLLGAVASAGAGSAPGQTNSAARVRGLHARLTVPDPLAEQLVGLTGPVLLVDDLVDSGWTMALAARLLRQAGAPAVLPLALAQA